MFLVVIVSLGQANWNLGEIPRATFRLPGELKSTENSLESRKIIWNAFVIVVLLPASKRGFLY